MSEEALAIIQSLEETFTLTLPIGETLTSSLGELQRLRDLVPSTSRVWPVSAPMNGSAPGDYLVAVFSTRAKAEAFCERHPYCFVDDEDGYVMDDREES